MTSSKGRPDERIRHHEGDAAGEPSVVIADIGACSAAGAGCGDVLLFLSHADEDGEIAREIAGRLKGKDVSVYSSQDSASDFATAVTGSDSAIQHADAFLALLSPSFLTSTSCRRERRLALRRESGDDGAGPGFIRVLKVRETPYHQGGALHATPWYDLTSQPGFERALDDLARRLRPIAQARHSETSGADGKGTPSGLGQPRRLPLGFRNRERELEEIVAGIEKVDGEHFWVVIAPPQLGKSWFLDKIASELAQKTWLTIRFLDVRELPQETAADTAAMLRLLFGLGPQFAGLQQIGSRIARSICADNRPYLCLLDSAELLAEATIGDIREFLSDVSQRVERAGRVPNGDAHLAFVAASRRDNRWKGVAPRPRFKILRLTGFEAGVIRDVLGKMDLRISDTALDELAERVHRMSEGLPALLADCIGWIREHDWDTSEIDDQVTFHEIATPYIEQSLLSPGSLRGRRSLPAADQEVAVRRALLVTSRYRHLTAAHVSHHFQLGDLATAAAEARWTVGKLWAALSDTDLLYRPEWEPWHEVYAPIRRLLFRYAYPSAEERAQAHLIARDFTASFLPELSGTDQWRTYVECLWHQAQALIEARPADLAESLLAYVSTMDGHLTRTSAFEIADLRELTAEYLENDEEFVDSLASIPELFDRLVAAVRHPT
jgi:hypothetical protein